MLTGKDLKGVCVMPPTPCKPGAEGWDATDSVDLDEAARMAEKLIQGGVACIAACGTTGECAALLWDEKLAYIDTLVQVNRGRVLIFAGATALGTKESVRQMRGLKDVGADGAFLGLPLWQTPTLENSVQFFADLAEAVPDMPIMIYANSMFFKSTFPTAFWEGVGKKAPTVITNKVAYGIDHLLDDIRVAGHQVNFMPGQNTTYPAWKAAREAGTPISACWSTSAAMGPEPIVALMDAMLRDDVAKVEQIWVDLQSVPPMIPHGEFSHFPEYNAQVEKARFRASGFVNCGPSRAPYRDLPEHWAKQAEAHGKGWAELRKRYLPAAVA
ncbi:MAG TPA: dihydrodipicolinate synthase family protein [Chloroflexota bacterium]|nr:dihydrodipicolinate synthase family protein [Chloroflexota bacterium]